ncbi:MAG: hypothetical protein HUJ65_04870, partial [Oscillospiraceae bacterium]|nr:hypothetical protein [Oscillospiraceae bacterium]
MLIIGAVLSLLVPFLIYRYILKGTERTITNGKYITTFLLSATVYMIPIIIIQLAFDRIFKINPAESSSILEGILVSFFRAALLEEGTKFFFVNQT